MLKIILLALLAFVAGAAFICAGIYFLTGRFLRKLDEGSADDVVLRKKNEFRARGSGFTAIALGALTIVWGIMLLSLPQLAAALALVYMIFLIAAFLTLTFVFS